MWGFREARRWFGGSRPTGRGTSEELRHFIRVAPSLLVVFLPCCGGVGTLPSCPWMGGVELLSLFSVVSLGVSWLRLGLSEVLLTVTNPRLNTFLRRVVRDLVRIMVSCLNVFESRSSSGFLESPRLSRVVRSFLSTSFSGLRTISVRSSRVRTFFVLLPRSITEYRVLVRSFLIIRVYNGAYRHLDRLFMNAENDVTRFVGNVRIVALRNSRVNVSRRSSNVALFSRHGEHENSSTFLLRCRQVFGNALSLELSST